MSANAWAFLTAALPLVGGWLKSFGLRFEFTIGNATPPSGGGVHVSIGRGGKKGRR